MDKISFKIFLSVISISIIIFAGLLFLSKYITDSNKELKLAYVTNHNIFFTVEECINKYVLLLNQEDSTSIYNLIDEDYKKNNDINIYNVLSNNKQISNYSIFTTQKILEDKNNKNTYYVSGYLTSANSIDDEYIGDKMPYSLIVKLDFSTYTYSVIPEDVEAIVNAF